MRENGEAGNLRIQGLSLDCDRIVIFNVSGPSIEGYEKIMTQPLISVTSPRETNEKTIFFPLGGKEAMKRSVAPRSGKQLQTNIIIFNDIAARVVNTSSTPDLSRVKSGIRRSDTFNIIGHHASNKENLLDYDDRNRHVITTRYGSARRSTTREREHVLPFILNMSGSKTQAKKVKIAPGSLRVQGKDGKQSLTPTREKKLAGYTSGHENDNMTRIPAGVSTVHGSRSPKITSKEGSLRHFVEGKAIGKPTAAGTSEEKRSKFNPALLQVKDGEHIERHSKRVSPGLPLEQIAEKSSTVDAKRSVNHTATNPEGLGSGRKARTPSRVTPNASQAALSRRNDESRGQSLEDRVQELELPKVTMTEVLQSWNIGTPSRTRSTSLAGKDPMEFLRLRERSDTDPKQRTTTVEELRRCRYLRTGGKDDREMHAKFCSCNSCEHGEGLKSTPYLNS